MGYLDQIKHFLYILWETLLPDLSIFSINCTKVINCNWLAYNWEVPRDMRFSVLKSGKSWANWDKVVILVHRLKRKFIFSIPTTYSLPRIISIILMPSLTCCVTLWANYSLTYIWDSCYKIKWYDLLSANETFVPTGVTEKMSHISY